MTVTETKQATGSWSVRLREDTPRSVTDQLDYFGHIVIATARVNPAEYGDTLLSPLNSRYVGVFLRRPAEGDRLDLGGKGMAWWLGDSQKTSDLHETAVVLSGVSFVAAVTALLPPNGSVTAGAIAALPGLYTGTHQYVSPREAIDYITGIYQAEWRVNGNGTLDAGAVSDLYVTTPRAILQRKRAGDDLTYRALAGAMSTETDVEDYTTRVFLLAEGEGTSIATGEADGPATPYNDIHGNDVVLTRLVSESETTAANADQRATINLAAYDASRASIRLSSEDYDVKGDVVVGDTLYVHDPGSGLYDNGNEAYWEGEPIHPIALRCIEMTFPIREGWGVFFRRNDGSYIDLTSYVEFETGGTEIVVGDLGSSLAGLGSSPVGDRPNLPVGSADTTLPDTPAFLGSSVGAYQSEETNTTKAVIWMQWTTPLNQDSSVITDGDRYEIRYRVDIPIGYKIRWGQLEPYRWGELETNRWGAPLSAPVAATPEWQTALIGWGKNEFTLTELTPGVPYELQIRAVDTSGHQSPWSTSLAVTTTGDIFPPAQPAAPTVAGNLVAIQVVHNLGKNSGGTFNLDRDLDHLNVHVGGSASFYPDEDNRVGRLVATAGMLQSQIPAVGSFGITPTETVHVKVVAVDRAGNKSSPSPSATVTAQLIDNQHISDLSVSKLTAGTITANSILAAQMEVGTGGSVVLNEGRVIVRDNNGRTIIEMGKRTTDPAAGYGLTVFDSTGAVMTRMGQTVDNTYPYGLEAVNSTGELVSLSTLSFGLRAAFNLTQISTTSGTYVDLGGPEVTVDIGSSGRCLIFVSAKITASVLNAFAIRTTAGFMSCFIYNLSGTLIASTQPLETSFRYDTAHSGGSEYTLDSETSNTRMDVMTGLAPGRYVFKAMYSCITSADAVEFDERHIAVLPY